MLYLTAEASPHFARQPIVLQVAAVQSWPSYNGWIWLAGWQLDDDGTELWRRAVYVRIAGIVTADW